MSYKNPAVEKREVAIKKWLKRKIKALGTPQSFDELRDSSADIDEIATEASAGGELDAYNAVLEFLES